MSKRYINIQNMATILDNLMLLNEMKNSVGYADENGYFTKRAIAEIAVNSYTLTSGGLIGAEVLSLVNDQTKKETDNPVLQQAKMRMQILRMLGFVATDYDSELYAITDFGNKALELIFPMSNEVKPDYSLLLEAFMGISTSSEVYEHNCDESFNCYIGYNICYAFANLDYMISVVEMPILTTYSIEELPSFIEDAKNFREKGISFSTSHEHFPKKQNGEPVSNATFTNITRVINQILRLCGLIEKKTVNFGGQNYYVCTSYGKEYVEQINKRFKKYKFITPQTFRRKNLLKQKEICSKGYYSILSKGGYSVPSGDQTIIFSPYQMIHEHDVQWLLEYDDVRKPPVVKHELVQEFTDIIKASKLRLEPTYMSQADYDEFIRTHVSRVNIISEVIQTKSSGLNKEVLIDELVERHKNDDQDFFYPFVRSLFEAMGMENKGEQGRIDGYMIYNNIVVPIEIKSPTEYTSYNIKGARQALENKLFVYNKPTDLEYASLLVGFSHPSNDNEVMDLIEAAYEEWGIKILAFDLRSVVTMCVDSIWDEKQVDFDSLLRKHGVVEV